MSRISIAAVMFAFCISALAGPLIIPFLRRLKCGQTVRDDGPAAHLKKSAATVKTTRSPRRSTPAAETVRHRSPFSRLSRVQKEVKSWRPR